MTSGASLPSSPRPRGPARPWGWSTAAAARARRDQRIERSPDLLKLRDLVVDLGALDDRLPLDVTAIGPRIGSQREQFLNLAQREAKFLCLPNEADALDDLATVETEAAAARPRWLFDQPAPLVEANSFDTNTSALSGSANGKLGHHEFSPTIGCTPYMDTESRE